MLLRLLSLLLLITFSSTAPVTKTEKIVIDESFFPESLVIYTSKHEIVKLLVPLNGLNFDDDDETKEDNDSPSIFFIEADIKENGDKDYKGLYILKNKKATKLLDGGQDFTATIDKSRVVFFGAKDGIYLYNEKENKAEKFGSLNENVIGMAKENATDVLYVLNADHELLKITNNGDNKEKVSQVKNPQQIVMDYENNLYYYDTNKKVHVFNSDGIHDIAGLPENGSTLTLVRPPFVITDGVVLIVDKKAYTVFANGTSELSDFEIDTKPSAYSMELALIQYYGYNKKIYEYNLLLILLSGLFEGIQTFLNEMSSSIASIATKPQIFAY